METGDGCCGSSEHISGKGRRLEAEADLVVGLLEEDSVESFSRFFTFLRCLRLIRFFSVGMEAASNSEKIS